MSFWGTNHTSPWTAAFHYCAFSPFSPWQDKYYPMLYTTTYQIAIWDRSSCEPCKYPLKALRTNFAHPPSFTSTLSALTKENRKQTIFLHVIQSRLCALQHKPTKKFFKYPKGSPELWYLPSTKGTATPCWKLRQVCQNLS